VLPQGNRAMPRLFFRFHVRQLTKLNETKQIAFNEQI